jgi:hypothetical protein
MPESELQRIKPMAAMPTLRETRGNTPSPTGSGLTKHLEMANRLSESMDVTSTVLLVFCFGGNLVVCFVGEKMGLFDYIS